MSRPFFHVFAWFLSCCFIGIAGYLSAAPPWNDYLEEQVVRMATTSRDDLNRVTPDNWEPLRMKWRSELQEMLGLLPWPEKTELSPVVTRKIQREGYFVENLHFQSRPGLYVSANLFLPSQRAPQDGWPTVLYVCGHANVTDQGRLLGNKTGYQHHGIWLARHGVACLMIDTIQLGELHGEHHGTYKLGRWDWMTRGYTPAGVEAWNAMRAIDYLETRKEIDAKRIGITGRSGGGAYSWFAAALDDRIRVAVPVAGITDLENHIVDGCVEGHCDCMYFVNTYGWDYSKLAALMAPRPLLLTNTDSDSIFPLDGVMRIHRQLADLYRRLGKSNDYGVLIGPGPHKDIQELQVGAFRWLLKVLTSGEVTVQSAALKELEPIDLTAFPREIPLDEKVTSISSWFVETAPIVEDEKRARLAWDQSWRSQVHRRWLTNQEFGTPSTKTLLESTTDRHAWKLIQLQTGSSWMPQWIEVKPRTEIPEATKIVHLGAASECTALDAQAINSFLTTGKPADSLHEHATSTHYWLLPRGWDSEKWNVDAKKRSQIHRRFYLLGQSIEGLQLHDYQHMLWAIDNGRTTESNLHVQAYDRAGPLASILALESRSNDSRVPRISELTLHDYPEDARFAPCLLGLLQILDFTSLRTAAQNALPVHLRISSSEKRNRLLVDTHSQPQQATGIRIVDVDQSQATIWSRATRWSLPNLSDQSGISFVHPAKQGGNQNSGAILPTDGIDGLRHAAPGVQAEMRIRYRQKNQGPWIDTVWTSVEADHDYSLLTQLKSLKSNAHYELRAEARGIGASEVSSTVQGSFKTLPTSSDSVAFRIAIGTCQEFDDRDGPHGFDVYRTMTHRKTDAFIMAGDVVYYDKLARSIPLANYHWQRIYSLPTLLSFHKHMPTYFLKDDHDTYVNDSWPNHKFDWTDQFAFEDGQKIFRQQTGLPNPAYRTFSFGKDLRIWMLEGRDYRSPNSERDSPKKSILGTEQKAWLKKTLSESTEKFRVIVSPTPIVGPDRENKKDNLSNSNFTIEGIEIRTMLASHPNTFVVCGDRHWQYHSIDPKSQLHEFSVGPVSNRHAGGWNQEDYRQGIHQYLRVAGGYLELSLELLGEKSRLVATHLDPYGHEHHRHVWQDSFTGRQ